MLIAVAAFAIVLAAINTVYYSTIRLRNKTSRWRMRCRWNIGDHLKRDLAGIVLPGGTMLGPFKPARRQQRRRPVSPNFYPRVLDETSPWADVQRVSYLWSTRPIATRARPRPCGDVRNLLPALQDQQDNNG
jgi:hypothetical protein